MQPRTETVEAIYRRSLAASAPCAAVVCCADKLSRYIAKSCRPAGLQLASLAGWMNLVELLLSFRNFDGENHALLLWLQLLPLPHSHNLP